MESIVQLNSNANLSEHFVLGEFTRSKYPEVYNIPSHEAIANLKRLCEWLEVLRERVRHSIIINSGYRSPQLNRKVGGAPTSNHLTGCAADIRTNGMEQAIVYAAILIAQIRFQSILLRRYLRLYLAGVQTYGGERRTGVWQRSIVISETLSPHTSRVA